ncbi:MAG: hypothetical protein UW28_C0001G0015 [Parcubacteria group bacterium GW2011_GWA2_44_13]|nr:MAG: hypothetical protein UW28_C0001G0015 [Parcubacteria group bacterium GW2011_GWA2_44_13]
MQKRTGRKDFIKMLRGFSLVEPSFKVWTLTFGDHKSIRTGDGMEFREFRQYEHGDDIASFDVEASLRTGEKLARLNLTEEKVKCAVILDDSPSLGYYGMRGTALLAAGCYLMSAIKKKDPASMIIYSNDGKIPFISPNIFSAEDAIGLLLDLFDRSVSRINQQRKNTFAELASKISRCADLSNSLAVMVSDFSFSDVFVYHDDASKKEKLTGYGEFKRGMDMLSGGREARDIALIGVAPYWNDFLELRGFFSIEDSETGQKKTIHFDNASAGRFVARQRSRERILKEHSRFLDIPMAWLHSGDNVSEEIEKTFI